MPFLTHPNNKKVNDGFALYKYLLLASWLSLSNMGGSQPKNRHKHTPTHTQHSSIYWNTTNVAKTTFTYAVIFSRLLCATGKITRKMLYLELPSGAHIFGSTPMMRNRKEWLIETHVYCRSQKKNRTQPSHTFPAFRCRNFNRIKLKLNLNICAPNVFVRFVVRSALIIWYVIFRCCCCCCYFDDDDDEITANSDDIARCIKRCQ